MIAYIDESGVLHIQTQCSTEAYALDKWKKDNEIPEHGSCCMDNVVIESSNKE